MSDTEKISLSDKNFDIEHNKFRHNFELLKMTTIQALEDKNWAELVIEAIGDGISIIDPNFQIIYQNEPHRILFGDHPGEYCYKAFLQRETICEDCPALAAMLDAEIQMIKRTVEMGGEVRDLEITASPFRDSAGKIIAAIQIVRDVTRRNELEEQLHQSQKMEAIGLLVSGLAHDLNNILSAVVGYSEMVLEIMPEEDFSRKDIVMIHDAGQRGAALTSQTLSFCRKKAPQKKVVNLNRVVEEVSKMLALLAGKENKFILDLQASDNNILADSIQIEQALMNLVVNAKDAMHCGGKLVIETGGLLVDTSQANNAYNMKPGSYNTVTVSDTGTGIPLSIRDKVFKPFFTTKEYGRGSGLGLSIVKGIVDQHNGYVHILNESCEGTSIQRSFPAAGSEPMQQAVVIDKTSSVSSEQATLFVVDKDPNVRKLVYDILSPMGYRLLEAACGEKAWEIIKASENRVDLLICEAMMSDITGTEMAEVIRLLCPDVKVLYMKNDAEYVAEQHQTPDFLALSINKPLVPNILVDKVREVLN